MRARDKRANGEAVAYLQLLESAQKRASRTTVVALTEMAPPVADVGSVPMEHFVRERAKA